MCSAINATAPTQTYQHHTPTHERINCDLIQSGGPENPPASRNRDSLRNFPSSTFPGRSRPRGAADKPPKNDTLPPGFEWKKGRNVNKRLGFVSDNVCGTHFCADGKTNFRMRKTRKGPSPAIETLRGNPKSYYWGVVLVSWRFIDFAEVPQ